MTRLLRQALQVWIPMLYGIIAFMIPYILLWLLGASENTGIVTSFIIMVPVTGISYFRTKRWLNQKTQRP